MFRPLLFVPAFCLLTTPLSAEDFQTIGTIEALFDGETLSQTTMSYLDEGQRLGTASLSHVMGITSLTIQGAEGRPIAIEAMFSDADPDPQSRPTGVSVAYFPSGMQDYWTSEDAPDAARITFESLDAEHASGTFEAELCLVPEGSYEADIDTCKQISGRFDTALIAE